MKWEYKVIKGRIVPDLSINKISSKYVDYNIYLDKLNQLGEDGWELIIYSTPSECESFFNAIFKRPKNQG